MKTLEAVYRSIAGSPRGQTIDDVMSATGMRLVPARKAINKLKLAGLILPRWPLNSIRPTYTAMSFNCVRAIAVSKVNSSGDKSLGALLDFITSR